MLVVALILIGEIGLLGLGIGVRHVFVGALADPHPIPFDELEELLLFVELLFVHQLLFHPPEPGFLAITTQFHAICHIGLGMLIPAAYDHKQIATPTDCVSVGET